MHKYHLCYDYQVQADGFSGFPIICWNFEREYNHPGIYSDKCFHLCCLSASHHRRISYLIIFELLYGEVLDNWLYTLRF